MKIVVLLRENINFGGPGVPQNRLNSAGFPGDVKSGLPGGTFADFSDFWEPFGGQWGSKWAQKGLFFGGLNVDRFWKIYTGGSAAWADPL